MMVAPTVVLDLDGTLVDSAPDLVATLNIIFARTGLPPVAYDAARNMVGGGAHQQARMARGAPPRRNGALPTVRHHLRRRHVRVAKTEPGNPAAHDRACRRGSRLDRHGGRLPHRHYDRARGRRADR